jgi:hypothetical protein
MEQRLRQNWGISSEFFKEIGRKVDNPDVTTGIVPGP